MSSEDEFDLNYVKLDSKNEIKLLGADDYAAEMSTFFSTVTEFEQEKISKKVMKEIEKNIPENSELFKSNVDFAKKFIKIINENKKKRFNESVNRLLSLNFKEEFIFNYYNIFDISSVLAFFFSDIKKYKISTIDDLKKRIKTTNLQKYDFQRYYIKANCTNIKDSNSQSILNKSKSTDNSSLKDIKELNEFGDTIFESEEISYTKKITDLALQKSIKYYSLINSENNYSQEDENKFILTKESFQYPNVNKLVKKELKISKGELPIELLLVLYKLKDVKRLIFQIQNLEGNFKKLAVFILSNLDWLFIKGIDEVKFDLGNENIQQGLNKGFELRTEDLYIKNEINKENIFYEGSYRPRTVNCWIPEGDIYFEKTISKNNKNNNIEIVYNTQMTDDCIILDDIYISNIYDRTGNPTNIKYVIPVNYSLKNNLLSNCEMLLAQQKEQRISPRYLDEEEIINSTYENLHDEISIFDIDNLDNIFDQRSSINTLSNNQGNNNIPNNEFSNKNSTPYMLKNLTENYKSYFKMVLIYSNFFYRNLKNIKKLSLYFHTSYSYEMHLSFKTNLNFDLSHFLIFLNKIDTLKEVNVSFNSLDDKSFEYILGILFKNTNLNILRLSFFTPDINYYDNSLFNLCSSKKISLTKLFGEYDEFLKKNEENQDIKINDFILREKLLNSLVINLTNLTTLLKLQLLKNLTELVLRFDIPLPLQKNECYIILIIKFLMNILIMLTFQQNQTHTFKILAPNLELKCKTMPYIRSFFQEISLHDAVDKYDEITKADKERLKFKEKIEQLEKKNAQQNKEKELKEKNERGKLLSKISESDIITQIPQEKMDEFDIDINMENYDSSKRYKSMMQKGTFERGAQRRKSSSLNQFESKSRKLNPNDSLENIVLQMKIYDLPEIFNIVKINNISGIQSINLGNLDEISFKGFVTDYKLYFDRLKSLKSLKINLGISVLDYDDLENYIMDYLYINSPVLEEKFLLSNLYIKNETKMKELIELVYVKAELNKIIMTINNSNIDLFSKHLIKFIAEYKNSFSNLLNSLVLAMSHPKYKKFKSLEIPKYLSEFIGLKNNRFILCNENPENSI